ncbi:basic 7S globulin-like [Sesamum indicum]|uniref:Basic 7S globulin-like n=1 Tax=Sesamum indicum TaxID=4182 RepID=A0A6I9T6S2_SESIN|nr:basic 7S globulin-like [Sesamum indicum]
MSTFVLFCLLSLFFGVAFPAFLAPITTDLPSKKYMLRIYLKTPPQPANLLLDISASFSTLVYCSHSHYSSFGSTSCKLRSASPGPVCSSDSLSMPVTDGRNPGQLGEIPGFIFACGKRSLRKGLVKGAAGLAGLGRSNLSIPAQVSSFSSENLVFALCLSGSPSAPGVAFFGSGGPYYFLPEIDLSKFLNYTPLLSDPAGSGSTVINYSNPSNEYFIGLTAIKVNGKAVKFNQTLLSIDEKGFGGTKLSTVTPYTSLHSTIYRALTEAFVNESAALNLTITQPVKPFNVCYNADEVMSTRIGPAVPTVDFVLQDDDVIWRIFGWNSMFRIFRDGVDLYCLGFLDGGPNPRSSIVIGGHQMDDNLLQFDLQSNRLGFSSSLLVHGTMCANFNFTTNNNLR